MPEFGKRNGVFCSVAVLGFAAASAVLAPHAIAQTRDTVQGAIMARPTKLPSVVVDATSDGDTAAAGSRNSFLPGYARTARITELPLVDSSQSNGNPVSFSLQQPGLNRPPGLTYRLEKIERAAPKPVAASLPWFAAKQ